MLDIHKLNFIVCRVNPSIGKQTDKFVMTFHNLCEELDVNSVVLEKAIEESKALNLQMKWTNDDGTYYIFEKSRYNISTN